MVVNIWQSIYFDNEGIPYFFDSYGRVAPKIFKRFKVMIRGLYHQFDHYNHNVQRAFAEFTMGNFKHYRFNKAVNNIQRSLEDKKLHTRDIGTFKFKMTLQMYAGSTACFSSTTFHQMCKILQNVLINFFVTIFIISKPQRKKTKQDLPFQK